MWFDNRAFQTVSMREQLELVADIVIRHTSSAHIGCVINETLGRMRKNK